MSPQEGTISGTFSRHDWQAATLIVGESTYEAQWCDHCGQLTVEATS